VPAERVFVDARVKGFCVFGANLISRRMAGSVS
jgi:hypothetical protein